MSATRVERLSLDAGAMVGMVCLLGVGTVLALAGVGAGDLRLGLLGAGAGALSLVFLVAARQLDPFIVILVSLPLPALFLSDSLRLAPAAPATLVVVAAWVLERGVTNRPVDTRALPQAALAAFAGAYLVSGLFTLHHGTAARELLNLFTLGAFLLVATDLLRDRPGHVHRIARALAIIAGVTGALAILEAVGVLPGRFPEPGGLNRAALGFGQPNGLGMFLALCLPLTVWARGTAKGVWRSAGTLWIVLAAGGILATLSRGSILSVLAGALLLPLVGAWKPMVRIFGVALVGGLIADLIAGGAISMALVGILEDWSVFQRAALMLAGVRLFLENPLTGVGPGGFAEELDRAGVLVPTLWDLQATPHNAYIQVAAEAGILGLAAFLYLLGAVLRRLLRAARETDLSPSERSLRLALLWSLGVALAEGLVEWPLSHGHGQLVALVVAAGCVRAGPKAQFE